MRGDRAGPDRPDVPGGRPPTTPSSRWTRRPRPRGPDGGSTTPWPSTAGRCGQRDATAPTGPPLMLGPVDQLQIVAGSCRQQAPQPLWLRRRSGFGDLGPDALATLLDELRCGRREHPDVLLLTGDQVYADEHHRTVRATLSPAAGRPARGGTPRGRQFRGVHLAVPEDLVASPDPPATGRGPVPDDLRRPRRHRRLEHLVLVDRRHRPPTVVAGSDPLGADVVLGVPAPRQPGSRGSGRRPGLPGGAGCRRRGIGAGGARRAAVGR